MSSVSYLIDRLNNSEPRFAEGYVTPKEAKALLGLLLQEFNWMKEEANAANDEYRRTGGRMK